MRRIGLITLCLAACLPHFASAMTEQERRDYLAQLQKILPPVPATQYTPLFDDWLQTSKALPPDFDALPRQNALPDPLKFLDGRPVKTAEDWKARRQEIIDLEEKYQIGTIPPKPKLDKVEVVSETKNDDGSLTREVRLEFGPGDQAFARVSLTIPAGEGPFPVLIGGGGGFGGSGAAIVKRGYIDCDFAGTPPNPGGFGGTGVSVTVDTPTNLPQLYPNYDFGTMGQEALVAQMVVDYLETLPQVDKDRIAITGYSRLGKLALIAAALDPRIAAVVAGSTGVGGAFSWRQAGERDSAESIETTTRMFPLWFAPQLRFFAGREDRLPVDGNLLVAAVAPRACLIEYGMNDEVSNTWGDEQTLYSVQPLYAMLGQPDHVGIMRVPGVHGANNVQMYLDWLDYVFGRSKDQWVNNYLFPWSLQQWVANSGEKINLANFPAHQPGGLLTATDGKPITTIAEWEAKVMDIRKAINWLLGDAPAVIPPAGGPPDQGSTSPHANDNARAGAGARGLAGRGAGARGGLGGAAAASASVVGATVNPVIKHFFTGAGTEFGWIEPARSEMATRVLEFGEGVKGDLYYPANTPPGTKLPTVIWLHGYSYPLGYMWVYRRDLHPILALTQAGYAVLAYDQCGFGNRQTEIGPFFTASPHWSQMGRLVHDARSAIDALSKDDVVDPKRIYLYGYELGATTALYTAALDARVQGVVSVCGFTPMRTDTADRGTGGIARWSVERPLLPRLGFFIGHESQIPVDYPEIIAAIAPRPAVIVAPQLDRDANAADVQAALNEVRKVYALYQAAPDLMVDEPWDYARLPTYTQDWTIQCLNWASHNIPPAPAAAAN